MKLNEMPVVLKRRDVVDHMYVYTYVNIVTNQEIRLAKLIPAIKEVVVEGDDNDVVLPMIPDKIVIKGNNNKVRIEDNDLLEVPYFLTPEYVQAHRKNN